jgi:hypothetical protein
MNTLALKMRRYIITFQRGNLELNTTTGNSVSDICIMRKRVKNGPREIKPKTKRIIEQRI